jgi:hypothetical protein
MKEGKCFYCKEPGHVASACPHKKANELKMLETDPQNKQTEQGKD